MFAFEIPELIIDVEKIRKFVLELDPYQWEPMRRSKGLPNWPMPFFKYTGIDHMEPLREIKDQFAIDLGENVVDFYMVPEQTQLRIHKDRRNAGINLPIMGDFETAPLVFYDEDRKTELFRASYSDKPLMCNTSFNHGVDNFTDTVRVLLSISIYEPFDFNKIKEFYLQRRLLKVQYEG